MREIENAPATALVARHEEPSLMNKEARARRGHVRHSLQTLPKLADIHKYGPGHARVTWRAAYRDVRNLAHNFGGVLSCATTEHLHRTATTALLLREGYVSAAVSGYEKLAMGSPFMRARVARHIAHRGQRQIIVAYPFFAQ